MVRRLLYLNGIAILSVILFHATGQGFVAVFAWAHRYAPGAAPYAQMGSPSYYALRLIEQVVVVAIPAFLFVSGFFMAVAAGRTRATVSWQTVFNRIKYLVAPYLVWTVVALVLALAQGKRFSIGDLVAILLTGRISPVLYYVPLLCQFYLLSPWLVRAARADWKLLLALAAALQIAVQLTPYPTFWGLDLASKQQLLNLVPKWLFLARIFWFTLGIVVGFHLDLFKRALARVRWPLLVLTLILIPLGVAEWEIYVHLSGVDWLAHRETLLDSVYALGFLGCFVAFDRARLPLEDAIGALGARSYGIYLTHALVMENIARVLYHAAPTLLAYQSLLQPILIVSGLGLPLLAMAIVRRMSVARFYVYLFG